MVAGRLQLVKKKRFPFCAYIDIETTTGGEIVEDEKENLIE